VLTHSPLRRAFSLSSFWSLSFHDSSQKKMMGHDVEADEAKGSLFRLFRFVPA
jgi:hypothetical protein